MSHPLERRRIYENAAEQIKKLIESRGLKPGDKLPGERELVKLLGICRSSVREALRILEVMGLVEVKPGKGAFVKDPLADAVQAPLASWLAAHQEAVLELFEVRQLLEPEAACLAARRARPKMLASLETTWEEMKASAEARDLVGVVLADTDFHLLVAKATGNSLLVRLMEGLSGPLSESLKVTLRVPGQKEQAVEEHRRILEAIRNREGEKARALMEEHLRNARHSLEGVLQGEGSVAETAGND